MADSFAKYNPRRKEGNWTKHGRWLDESNSHLDRANLEKYRLVAKRVMELEKRLVAATLSKDDRKSVGVFKPFPVQMKSLESNQGTENLPSHDSEGCE